MHDTRKVTINNVEYELGSLSDVARAHLTNIQATDWKISEVQKEMAMLQTARNAYAQALVAALPTN